MFKFDEEKVVQKIMSESDVGRIGATAMAQQLKKVTLPELQPYIETWYNGETPSFEFVGVSSDDIRKKEHGTYVVAILKMNRLIQDPEFREWYKQAKFEHM